MQITKNFRDDEFKCPCCGIIKYDSGLVDRLQILRNLFGKPIIITSGYRCPKYNTRVNGYIRSNHMTGHAADIKGINQADLALLRNLADKVFYNQGMGTYKTFIHLDTKHYIRF